VDTGNTSGNITMSATGTTTINSLLQAAAGGTATINIGSGNTLRLASGGVLLSNGNGALTINNTGSLTAGATDNTLATLFLNNQSATNSITVNAVIANNGSGVVSLSKTGGTGTVILGGANSYSGTTSISAGTLAMNASDVLSNNDLSIDGATAMLAMGASHNDTVGTVTLNTGGSITGSGTSTLTSTGTFELKNGSVSAILGGNGIALNKTTAGTVTLSGANTFTGTTTITDGMLAYGASNVIGSGDVVVNGATAILAMGYIQIDSVGSVTVY
jgi:autotransporter-associated beta strand protein